MTADGDDLLRDKLFESVRPVIDLLVAKDYRRLIQLAGSDRYSPEDASGLEDVIKQYGCTLVKPPDDASRHMNIIRVELPGPPRWAVDMPLWTAEEGLSDLEVRLTLIERDGTVVVELDDLLVP